MIHDNHDYDCLVCPYNSFLTIKTGGFGSTKLQALLGSPHWMHLVRWPGFAVRR